MNALRKEQRLLTDEIVPPWGCANHYRMKGLTLVELLIVIAVIGIIATVATIEVAWFMRDAKLSESRDRLIADVEDIKLKSISGVPHALFITGGNSTSYTVRRLTDANNNFVRDSGEVTMTLSTVNLPSSIRISGPAAGELWFDRKGIPRSSTWQLNGSTLTLWHDKNNDGSADTAEEQYKQITVSSTGRIKYE